MWKPAGKCPPLLFEALLALVLSMLLTAGSVRAQAEFERLPVARVEIAFEDGEEDPVSSEWFRGVVVQEVGAVYSTVRLRNGLQALFDTKRIERASVEARLDGGSVAITFKIKRKQIVRRVSVQLGRMTGRQVSQDAVLVRLNLLTPGSSVTEQTIKSNIDSVLAFFFDNGYYNAKASAERRLLRSGTDVEIVLRVEPGEQAKVSAFKVAIAGLDDDKLSKIPTLKAGAYYSREAMMQDFERIRKRLLEKNLYGARLQEPETTLDRDSNTVEIEVRGTAGPPIDLSVEIAGRKAGDEDLVKLLPIRREGTLDYSAIVEGERLLEERFQERGYFFADVSAVCSVTPPFGENEASYTTNGTPQLCSALGGADLSGRSVSIDYTAELGNILKLVDIRIKGLEDFLVDEAEICRVGDGEDNLGRPFPIGELKALLRSSEASLIGLIPYLGYGRGYTSTSILAEDTETIRSLLDELGYRDAKVVSRQGVSLNGDELIITFEIQPGQRTRINSVEFRGNKAFMPEVLTRELDREFQGLDGKGYSRALVRNAARRISDFYSDQGFFEARVNYSVEDIQVKGRKDVKVILDIENEGSKASVNRVLVTGNRAVSRQGILTAAGIRAGERLKSAAVFSGEQNLYATDMFRKVEIRPEPAGEAPGGERLFDVNVAVEEQEPRVVTFGGGYSTDSGAFGTFDIRHLNLFGKLQQGGARLRWSRFRQLVQADFINPRFLRDGLDPDGTKRYAPLTLTVQYQRDSTVTRFFRSAFDKGTFGIVQRVDASGNPIDEFGAETGSPTINRFSVTAETSRTLSVRDRSIIFARYRYEDVRLSNFASLLIRDLLRPDARIRISGFGLNFARDTRENCRLRYSLLEIASKGSSVARCRYNPGDATKGSYLTAEYGTSIPVLGANVGFHKLQASYNVYYTPRGLRNTTLAGRAVLGLAGLFSSGNRFRGSGLSELEGMLPISERFFAGGSQSIRGFDFESAGPRILVRPQGIFRDGAGRPVTLNAFSVPFGGNALALVNLEARIPVSESVRLVPFYDGGNVYRKPGEILRPIPASETDVTRRNLRASWSNTVGLGLRLRTPVGGELAVDYGFLLNPPTFIVPQQIGPAGVYRLHQGQIHFRFAQAF